jgi:hypothetical protein
MAFDFPNSPAVDDIYTSGGKTYQWDGEKWVIVVAPLPAPPDLTAYVLKAGDVMSGSLTLNADPIANLGAATKQYVDSKVSGPLAYYIGGLNMYYANTTTFGVRPGGCTSDSFNDYMILSSNMNKTLAPWAAGFGNGGLDTGSVIPIQWYHVHLIKRPDTGVVDVIFSTSSVNPTMPANYTEKRRIGSFRTDPSGNIYKFSQTNDLFLHDVPIVSMSNGSFTAGATFTHQLIAPIGFKSEALFNIHVSAGAPTNCQITYWSGDMASSFASFPVGSDLSSVQGAAASTPSGILRVKTGVSANIYIYSNQAIPNGIYINTWGWYDTRNY